MSGIHLLEAVKNNRECREKAEGVRARVSSLIELFKHTGIQTNDCKDVGEVKALIVALFKDEISIYPKKKDLMPSPESFIFLERFEVTFGLFVPMSGEISQSVIYHCVIPLTEK